MDRRGFLKTASAGAAGTLFFGIGQPPGRAAEFSAEGIPGAAPPLGVLDLFGTPRERGRIHGESLREPIRALCATWKSHLGRPEGSTPDAYLERFLADTDFEPAIARFTPDVLEEIRGIAEGSGLPYRTALAMQLVDEEWWYSANGGAVPAAPAGEKCTVIAVAKTATSPTLLAQNLDIPGFCAPYMTVLRIRPRESDVEALVPSYAGLVALNGVNSRGVAVAVNALLPLADSGTGLPVACVIRGILERATLADAERFVRDVRHASGQAYSIGGPEGVVCYECSGSRVSRFEPSPGATRFVHTNHPLANDDLSPLGRKLSEEKTDPPGPRNSAARYRAAECRIVSPPSAAGIAEIRAALASHDSLADPICRHLAGEDSGFTAVSTIFELAPGAPRLHAAPNPPCAGRYAEHRLGAG